MSTVVCFAFMLCFVQRRRAASHRRIYHEPEAVVYVHTAVQKSRHGERGVNRDWTDLVFDKVRSTSVTASVQELLISALIRYDAAVCSDCAHSKGRTVRDTYEAGTARRGAFAGSVSQSKAKIASAGDRP